MFVIKPLKNNAIFLGSLVSKIEKVETLEGRFAKSKLKEKDILAKAKKEGCQIVILTGEDAEKALVDTTTVTDKDLITKVEALEKENKELKSKIEALEKAKKK